MLLSMRHVELHTVHSNADIERAHASGLVEEDFVLTDCAGCAGLLGDNASEFEPFVFCLDDESLWVVCLPCAENVLDPSSTDSVENLYEGDVDFDDDNFALFDD